MAAPKKAANVERITVAKRGRSAGPTKSTLERFAKLDEVFKGSTITLEVVDDNGNVTATHKAHKVTPESIGAPAGYTGLAMLVGSWAKDRGHSVKLLAGQYIVSK